MPCNATSKLENDDTNANAMLCYANKNAKQCHAMLIKMLSNAKQCYY